MSPDLFGNRSCVGHLHQERTPLTLHHLRPMSRGGKHVIGNTVWMCLNLHECVHTLLDEIEATAHVGTALDANQAILAVEENWRTSFSSVARGIAYRGWQLYGPEFLLGRWSRSYALWTSDGTPKRDGVPPYQDVAGLHRTVGRLLRTVRP
jgi:hypothetical protein